MDFFNKLFGSLKISERSEIEFKDKVGPKEKEIPNSVHEKIKKINKEVLQLNVETEKYQSQKEKLQEKIKENKENNIIDIQRIKELDNEIVLCSKKAESLLKDKYNYLFEFDIPVEEFKLDDETSKLENSYNNLTKKKFQKIHESEDLEKQIANVDEELKTVRQTTDPKNPSKLGPKLEKELKELIRRKTILDQKIRLLDQEQIFEARLLGKTSWKAISYDVWGDIIVNEFLSKKVEEGKEIVVTEDEKNIALVSKNDEQSKFVREKLKEKKIQHEQRIKASLQHFDNAVELLNQKNIDSKKLLAEIKLIDPKHIDKQFNYSGFKGTYTCSILYYITCVRALDDNDVNVIKTLLEKGADPYLKGELINRTDKKVVLNAVKDTESQRYKTLLLENGKTQ